MHGVEGEVAAILTGQARAVATHIVADMTLELGTVVYDYLGKDG